VQTDGATNFDQPAPVCFPNLPDPDTGDPLAAGEKSALFSFNHDTGRWEIAGSMTVSEDGTLICADEGVGVRAPGWHGSQPGSDGQAEPPVVPPEEDPDNWSNNNSDPSDPDTPYNKQFDCLNQKTCDSRSEPSEEPNWAEGFPKYMFDYIAKQGHPSSKMSCNSGEARVDCIDRIGKHHVEKELKPGFESYCREIRGADNYESLRDQWRSDHNTFLREVVEPCFKELLQPEDFPWYVEAFGSTYIKREARSLREEVIIKCDTGRIDDPRVQTSLLTTTSWQGLPPPLTQEELYSEEISENTTLEVDGLDLFFMEVGTTIQLIVTKDGDDITASSTGTQYFLAVEDDIATISSEGLLSVLSTPRPHPSARPLLYVTVTNGDDIGVGQFSIVDVDTDGDLIVDSYETKVGLNPNVTNSLDSDIDGDGLTDLTEVTLNAQPTIADTDGDGIDDGTEVQFQTGVLNPSIASLIPQETPHYFALQNLDTDLILRGLTSNSGRLSNLNLAANTRYRVWMLQPETLLIGMTNFDTASSGTTVTLPPIVLGASTSLDLDNDGLPNDTEFVVGTNANNPDTDDDGISDGAEVQQGTNPLDGLAVTTGIIASVDTPGTALDVCALNDIAAVADSEAGMSVFNVFNGMNPSIIAQVDTQGNAQAVACAGDLIAVADGEAGLAIIDISDPPAARVIHQIELDGRAQTVAAGGNLAYVGTSDGKVAIVELSSGAGLYGLTFSEAVHDVALSGDELYVLTASSLFIYGTSSGGVEELGSLPVSGSPAPLEVGRKLFVGGNLAYVGYFTGYSVIDVSDPTIPQLIGSPPETQAAMHDIVANGSGLVLGTTSFAGPSTLAVSLYDSSDPTDVTQFMTSFDTPGAARALAIYNGLAYVADQAGMQVVNYLAYDSQGVPPTIALTSNVAGNEVAEGGLVRVTADVSDDVQVRNVEFYLDGNRIAIDGTFPFEYRFPAPSLSTQSTFTVMARAKDTGGNTTESNLLTVNVIPDTEPPTVAVVEPVVGEFFTRLDSGIPVKVNATDNVRVADLSFKVDGTPVSAIRVSLNTYEVAMPATIGTYQISVVATDGAGLSAESTPISVEVIDFEVGDQLSGKIDYSGDLDRYAFSAEAGQVVFFDWQSQANSNWRWQLVDSAGTIIFNQDLRSDPGAHTLELGGTYTMIIGNRQREHTGSYRLQLLQAPPPDEFTIAIGDVVSNGVPESGAGNIEQPGAVDLYTFQAEAGQRVFFDWQADLNFGDGWRWQVIDSAGTVIFDKSSLSDDPGAYLLELGGTYTMKISAPQNDDPGTYQFQLLHVPQPDEFSIAIGDVVSDGVPASGAGNIEQPAAIDLYTFEATAGQLVYFDLQAGANRNWLWQLTDSTGSVIFNRQFSDDPGAYTLSLGGTYTMRIGNYQSDNTGTYQFQLLNVPPPQEFSIAIGDIVSDGDPAPGAGNIEKPGALDAYTFDASAGQLVYFDLQAGFNQNWRWQLADSTGNVIFNQSLFADPGAYTLELGGAYTMIIGNLNSDDSGTYQFQLLAAPEPDIFGIALGDVVSNGVPAGGAGNLEAPAAQDIYTFNAPSGEFVFFDLQTGANQNWQWELQDSDGTSIFNRSFSSDPGAYTLEISGTYTVTVSNLNSDETGSYRFKLWDVPPPEEFTIAIGDVVSNGVPEAGAGNIEQPAALDRYTFLATAGQVVYFDWQSQFNSNWRWQLVDSAGTVIFERSVSSDPGAYTLELGGTYTMIIGNQNSDDTGTYQFQLLDVPAPDAFNIAIGDVVSDGVPQAGAGNIEEPGSLDRYAFEASAGQVLFFDWQSEFNSSWRWQLLDSAGTAIFNRGLSSDPGAHTLELGGTYTMIIGNQNSEETGTYQLQLLEVPAAQTFSIAIGDVVSDGVPQAGAGNIEEPGALDIYTFNATAGQEVFFDWQGESNSNWRWKLENSDGTVIFEQNLSNDPGTHILELGGTYTMIIGNQNSDETGTYQFELRDPGQSNAFQINIGDVVSDGVPAPGAGNIEEPGSLDSYTFEATAGQVVYFDLQEGFNDDWRWKLEDSQGTVIFNQLFRNDPGSYELELGGTYSMTIGNQNSDHTGTYQFQLLAFRRSALAP
jgi:predicted secreted protein